MKQKIIFSALMAMLLQPVMAKVKCPALLADNMVLQQQALVNLWGEAKENHEVVIKTSWNQKTYKTRSGADGKWRVQVKTPEAGGPYDISFYDDELTRLSNILIGEVWFCSGQSNMEMPMKGFDRQPVAGTLDILLHASKKTPIRAFTVEKNMATVPLDSCAGAWMEHTPEGVAGTSATAYFFARYLNDVLGIPVGLIISDWGGSKIQPWMSEQAIRPYESQLDHLGKTFAANDRQWQGKACTLYNAMVAPVLPYTIRGMIWYQGESNSSDPDLYEKLFPAFVKGVRQDFGIGDFPFYYVQIAPYAYSGIERNKGFRLREVQSRLMNQIPNSGMAVTLDIGEETCIHPAEKEKVGKRLAYWALAKTYGKNSFAYAGPVYKAMQIEGGKVYLHFDYAPGGVAPLERELTGFEVAGNDRIFYPARAVVEAQKGLLGVSSAKVPAPVAVRYAYKDFVVGSLFDVYGLPASSFRTDDWE